LPQSRRLLGRGEPPAQFRGGSRQDMRRSRLSTEKHPRADRKRRVEHRERQQQIREHAGSCQRQENRRNEGQSVDHRCGNNLSRARTTAEQVEPADDRNRQPYGADKSLLVADESALHEKRLRHAWPSGMLRRSMGRTRPRTTGPRHASDVSCPTATSRDEGHHRPSTRLSSVRSALSGHSLLVMLEKVIPDLRTGVSATRSTGVWATAYRSANIWRWNDR
jgi:hypothetical protein